MTAPGRRVPEPDVARHLTAAHPAALHSATVTAADLAGAALPALEEVQVEASSLERVQAAGGRWRQVTLVDCRLDGADLANLHAEDLTLVRTSLREVRLVGAQLPVARLRAVRLQGCQARLSSWRGAHLQHVELLGCDLAEADLTEVQLDDVLLQDCDLTGAHLAGLRCRRVRLSGCRLAGVTGVSGLRGASLAEADALALLPAMARELGLTIEG
jgi:uncharacterized protein YjbI with pentapeptide repeats